MNVEQKTGHLFTDTQVANHDSRIINTLLNGGRQFFTPIWGDLGTYQMTVSNSIPIGINQVTFNVDYKLLIYAQMYASMDSKTVGWDQLLVQLVYPDNPFPGGIPEGWTQEDVDWLKQ